MVKVSVSTNTNTAGVWAMGVVVKAAEEGMGRKEREEG